MDKFVVEKNRAWIDATWEKIDKKMSRMAIKSRDIIPYTTVDGKHNDMVKKDLSFWTNGFYGGAMWILYLMTKNEEYKACAIRQQELVEGAFNLYGEIHHDVGFMFHLTCGANYRITGDPASRIKNLYAASFLSSRYNIDGKFITAWNVNEVDGPVARWSIIDCLMNIPLLYWASKETKVDRFKRVAMSHADMAIRDHIRSDGSVNHIVEHELNCEGVVKVHAGQGYAPDSCWSRGLAWAVYGSILSYIHTGKVEYLDAAKRTANYFITNAAVTGYKAVVDFMAPKEPVYYDSTAGVITASGLLEIAKYVSESEARMYTEAAINLLRATDEHFADYTEEQDALVLMGSERYPTKENYMKTVHIPIVYGDYYYIEAIAKLKGLDFLMW